ncbi:MAG: T9SS type A sorting domain-containing protein, partial [Saprospiraceae bacterium]
GFVEVYDFLNNNWQRVGQKLKGNVNNTSMFGLSVDISSDGKTIATSSTHSGIVQVYETSINVNTTQKGNLKKVELFPIPIFNYVNIRGDFLKEKAIIYSIDGRKLYEFKINEISNFKLDLSFLSRGIYMMEIYDDKGNKYIQKMIK